MEHPLLAQYLAGECSAAEADEVRRWIAASPENRRSFEQVEALWQASPVEPGWDVGAALAKVEQAIRERPPLAIVPGAPVPAPAAPTRRRWVVVAKVAAALVVIAGGIVAVRHGSMSSARTETVAEAALRTVVAPRGQRATFQLPDGTKVILGPASTLRYSDAFGTAARAVALTGQAYFDVQHDARRPFVVHAGKLIATDLGTAFTVTAYPDDADPRVVVQSGLVSLRPATAPSEVGRAIKPGELGRLGLEGEPIVERADTAALFAWTRGELVLTDVPLREAAVQLSRWYDVDVQLASPEIGARRLEASFNREPVADVFRLIAASLQLQVERTGRLYTLSAR